MTHSSIEAPTDPTELNIDEGTEYIATPTVLPKIMLMAEKVPSLPSEDSRSNCGVEGTKPEVFEGETRVVLDEISSSLNLLDLVLTGDATGNVLGVTR